MIWTLAVVLQGSRFQVDAPLGTGLEWLTLGAILVPAILLILLVYLAPKERS